MNHFAATTVIGFFAGATTALDRGAGCLETGGIIFSSMEFQICVDGTIENFQSLAWAGAFAYAVSTDPKVCFCEDSPAVDADVGIASAEAYADACAQADFSFGAAGGSYASISAGSTCILGVISTYGVINNKSGDKCYPCFASSQAAGGGGAGLEFSFTIGSPAQIDVDLTPPPVIYGDPDDHIVSANILCIPGLQPIYSAYIGGWSNHIVVESSSVIIPPGSYSMLATSVLISDALDDVTGDDRFNQDDIDFLDSIVGTPAASDPLYARFDYLNDPLTSADDGVQGAEVGILQCFVDSGLSSGYVGDADQDGQLDCDDIALAYAHFTNVDGMNNPIVEVFPDSDYIVQLDADLDGDNDASDYTVVIAALRDVEPANFFFDANLNFFDTSEFLAQYNANDPRADLFPPGSPDGVFNFFDVSQFNTYYANPECP